VLNKRRQHFLGPHHSSKFVVIRTSLVDALLVLRYVCIVCRVCESIGSTYHWACSYTIQMDKSELQLDILSTRCSFSSLINFLNRCAILLLFISGLYVVRPLNLSKSYFLAKCHTGGEDQLFTYFHM